MYNKSLISTIVVGVLALIAIIAALSTFGINDNGYRTVVQLPSGTTFVKFEPGIYFDWFGSTTQYPDVLTYDFENTETSDAAGGVAVRYQDGGTGAIFGVARFTLPTSEEAMLEVHRAFRTEQGVRDKLLQPVLKEALNLTAGLMTSEEAYAEKRNEFIAWSEDQVAVGKYLTQLISRTQIVEPEELDANGAVVKRAVTRVQNVPVIRTAADGSIMRGESPFVDYGIAVSGFQLTDWTFEPKTLEQIQEKRAANMAIITSQANAAKANQQRLQAIAEGEKNVATARYEQEVEKARAVVVAQRQAEVAQINAAQQVAVNHQNYLAQQEDVKAAEQQALAIRARTTAEADAKRRMLEADNALQAKLDAEVRIHEAWAKAFSVAPVPATVFATGGGDGASALGTREGGAQAFIDILTAEAAQNLQYNRSVQPQRQQAPAQR